MFVAQSRGSQEKTQIWPLSTLPAKYPASAYFPEYQWAKSKERGGTGETRAVELIGWYILNSLISIFF